MEDRNSDHLVLGGLLFLVFSLVVALVFVYTRAGDTESGESPTTQAIISNDAPAVDSINIAYTDNGANETALDLTLGGQTAVVVWGVVSDANGADDIETTLGGATSTAVSVVFRRSGATNANSCTADDNDCYRVDACALTAETSTTLHYACSMNLEYFADGTVNDGGEFEAQNWVAEVHVVDGSAATGDSSGTTEVNGLLGLNIPTSIDYGTFTLGATSSAHATNSGSGSNVILDITQKGNVIADVEVSGTAMSCSGLGSIPIANQKYASTTPVGYDAAVALTGTAADTDLGVNYQKDDDYSGNPQFEQLFWYVGIPSSGVLGTCSGTNTISVLAAQ